MERRERKRGREGGKGGEIPGVGSVGVKIMFFILITPEPVTPTKAISKPVTRVVLSSAKSLACV